MKGNKKEVHPLEQLIQSLKVNENKIRRGEQVIPPMASDCPPIGPFKVTSIDGSESTELLDLGINTLSYKLLMEHGIPPISATVWAIVEGFPKFKEGDRLDGNLELKGSLELPILRPK